MTLIAATGALRAWAGRIPMTMPDIAGNVTPEMILAYWSEMHDQGIVAFDAGRGTHYLHAAST